MNKKIVIGIIAIAFIGIWLINQRPNELMIIFFDVGQGDSFLIRSPNGQNIIVDGGPDKKMIQQLGRALPFWDKKIDLVVLTHADADHLSGLLPLVEQYKVDSILQSSAQPHSKLSETWKELIKEQEIKIVTALSGQTIDFGNDFSFNILNPRPEYPLVDNDDPNDASVTIKLNFRNVCAILTGDLAIAGEEAIINAKEDIDCDVLKIGHHGSKTSTSQEFLNAVTPEIAVVQVGLDNKFSHPAQMIIDRLDMSHIKVYRTDQKGIIKLKTNGLNWYLQEK